MHNLNGIAEFVTTIELGSFVLAAQHVGMTASGVSKAVQRLESRIGNRLLNRSTRRLTLTEPGVEFYERCKQVLSDLREAEARVSIAGSEPSGTLRIDLPLELGRRFVIPALPKFLERHPKLNVRVVLREQYSDLVHQDIDMEIVDLAVRLGDFSMPVLPGRKIGATSPVTCASPRYLKKHGCPERPEYLLQHNCLGYLSSANWKTRTWRFAEGTSIFSLNIHGNAELSTNECLVRAGVSGMGIIQVHDYIVESAIKDGLLKPILADWAAPARPILVLLPRQRLPNTNALAFVNFLSKVLPENLRGLPIREPVKHTPKKAATRRRKNQR